jgi:dipeptidase E
MKLLLLSNSTTHGYGYLEHAESLIKSYFGERKKRIAFLPYAGITFSHDAYKQKVAAVFERIGHEIISVHEGDPVKIVTEADGIAVGGGNTFHLLYSVYHYGLMDVIREEVKSGKPYIGWSAGSNMACPTIKTTNDMPITQPPSFQALGLIPFQINPHYLDAHPDKHHGETREQRLLEFLEVNPNMYVAGLREGSTLHYDDGKLELIGEKQMRVFRKDDETREFNPGDDISFLLG